MKLKKEQKIAMLEEKMVMVVMGAVGRACRSAQV
tara:strand:- start:178 stop:279 length:102 start_codon:yes stop_codon:yes gene_type:complete